MARQAGVEEGIWTELWSRSLPVRLTQQQPCHGPNPPNHPLHHGGAETSKDWRRRIAPGIKQRMRKERDGRGRRARKGMMAEWKVGRRTERSGEEDGERQWNER